MAKLTVTEFARWGHPSNPTAGGPTGELASSSGAPAVGDITVCTLNSGTRYIALNTDTDCRVRVGAAADANAMPVFAKMPVILSVKGGEAVHAIAF